MKFSLKQSRTEKQNSADILNDIKKALNYTGGFTFLKNRCLVQSIAGRWMLQRRGILSKIYFGVNLDRNRKLKAHAWLKADNFELVEKGDDYKELINY